MARSQLSLGPSEGLKSRNASYEHEHYHQVYMWQAAGRGSQLRLSSHTHRLCSWQSSDFCLSFLIMKNQTQPATACGSSSKQLFLPRPDITMGVASLCPHRALTPGGLTGGRRDVCDPQDQLQLVGMRRIRTTGGSISIARPPGPPQSGVSFVPERTAGRGRAIKTLRLPGPEEQSLRAAPGLLCLPGSAGAKLAVPPPALLSPVTAVGS